MRFNMEKKRLTFMSVFLAQALLLGISTNVAWANEDMLEEADDALSGDALQMDDINLEGKLSASEKLKQRREKLEERNKDMVEKKIEDIRVKQEIVLTNKLQDAFGKSLNNLDEEKKVEVVPVAPIVPAPVVETKIEVIKEEPVEVLKSKIIPYIGMQSTKGDKIDFESKTSIGADFETMVASQISAGVGISYTAHDITDVSNDFLMNRDSLGQIYYTNYNSAFSSGRKLTASKLGLEMSSKYFFTIESKVKPFVGIGLNVNRASLKYEDSGNGFNYNGVNYGNEGYTSSNLGATLKLGTEVDFSKNIGMNINFSYSKALSSGITKNSDASNNNLDQLRLQNISKAMSDADVTALSAGLIIRF